MDNDNATKSVVYNIHIPGGSENKLKLNNLKDNGFKLLMNKAPVFNKSGFILPHPYNETDFSNFNPTEMTVIFGNGNYSDLIKSEDPYGRSFNELMEKVKENNIQGDHILEKLREFENEKVESIQFTVEMEGDGYEILTGKNVMCYMVLDGYVSPYWYYDPELPSYEVDVTHDRDNIYLVYFNFNNDANRWTWKQMLDKNLQFFCANIV